MSVIGVVCTNSGKLSMHTHAKPWNTVCFFGGDKMGKKRNKKKNKDRCPCCHYKTLPQGEDGSYSICPVCFWENDGTRNQEQYSSPNQMTLEQGRKNFPDFGACDEDSKMLVRPPNRDEI